MPNKTVKDNGAIKTVTDVKTLGTTQPHLAIVAPVVLTSTPVEVRLAYWAAIAADAPTIAMRDEATKHVNVMGAQKNFNADY